MKPLAVTSKNYSKEVLESKTPVLIDFWAPWCGPCKMQHPVMDELAEELSEVKVCQINVDEEPELTNQFQIMSIPTLVVVDSGTVVEKTIGLTKKESILDMLKK